MCVHPGGADGLRCSAMTWTCKMLFSQALCSCTNACDAGQAHAGGVHLSKKTCSCSFVAAIPLCGRRTGPPSVALLVNLPLADRSTYMPACKASIRSCRAAAGVSIPI